MSKAAQNRLRIFVLRPRQQGQILPIVMFMVIPFILLIGMIFNTGEHIKRKIETQNAADSAAITQGTWTARSMNVIAMNNVAITQAFVINIVGSVIYPVLVADALPKMGVEAIEIGRQAGRAANYISPCNACISAGSAAFGIGAAACFLPYASCYELLFHSYCVYRRSDNLLDVRDLHGRMMDDIGGFSATKVRDFAAIASALSAMNGQIIRSFPEVAQSVNEELATINGLSEPPRFFSAYSGNDEARRSGYRTTGLPVKSVGFLDGAAMTLLRLAPIKVTGEEGSSNSFQSEQRWNFQEHGYRVGRGPYMVAKERSERVVDELNGMMSREFRVFGRSCGGMDKPLSSNYPNLLDTCWGYAAPTQMPQFMSCPVPAGPITVHELDQDFLDRVAGRSGLARYFSDPDTLSLMGFTTSGREGGAIAPRRFQNPPGGVFGYAQAEIFNDTYPDLYTQNWRSKLREASLLSSNRRRDVLEATRDFRELNEFLGQFSAQQTEQLNVR